MDRVVDDLGPTRAATILEPDAVAADCFTAGRAAMLRQTVRQLAAGGRHVYSGAGHSPPASRAPHAARHRRVTSLGSPAPA